jgi:predicted DNA binding protein
MSEEIVAGEELEESESAGRRSLSDGELAEIRELYELGKAGLAEIASKYGVTRQALSKRLKAVGAVKGSRAHELAAAVKVAAVTSSVATIAASERFADRRAAWIEDTRIQGVQALKQAQLIARKIVADQLRATAPLAAKDEELKTLQRFNKILVDNIAAQIALLQADDHVDPTALPSLRIEDLTDDDILDHHKNIGALPDDATLQDLYKEEAAEKATLPGDGK